MKAHQAEHDVKMMARLLEVSRSGYYAWLARPDSARTVRDRELTGRIRHHHTQSRGTYGVPRIHADLTAEGITIGHKRVARLMKAAGLCGISRRRGTITTRPDRTSAAPDLLDRDFTATGPDQKWVADITYVPTWAGFVYLAVVLDVWSRRIVGWATADSLHTQVVLDALNMAIWRRRPTQVIHHSDKGSQAEFRWSSQHPYVEVHDGTATGVDGQYHWAAGDAVAWTAADQSRSGAGVLARDGQGAVKRGRCGRGWRVGSRRFAVVPRTWRDGINPTGSRVGALPVV